MLSTNTSLAHFQLRLSCTLLTHALACCGPPSCRCGRGQRHCPYIWRALSRLVCFRAAEHAQSEFRNDIRLYTTRSARIVGRRRGSGGGGARSGASSCGEPPWEGRRRDPAPRAMSDLCTRGSSPREPPVSATRHPPNTAFANCPDARSRRSRRPGLGGGCTIEPPYGRITAIRGATAAAQRRLASQPVGGGKRLALRAIRMWVGNTRRNATLVANSGGRILPLRRALVPIQEGTVRNWRGRRSKPEPRMGSHTV